MNLSNRAKATRLSEAVAAGTSDVTSDAVDMQGFLSAEFMVALGAITAGAETAVRLQGSSDGASWSNLEGTDVTVADDEGGTLVIIDLSRAKHRYVRCVVDRGTENAAVDAIICRQYLGRREPVEHDATVSNVLLSHAPAAVA